MGVPVRPARKRVVILRLDTNEDDVGRDLIRLDEREGCALETLTEAGEGSALVCETEGSAVRDEGNVSHGEFLVKFVKIAGFGEEARRRGLVFAVERKVVWGCNNEHEMALR